MAGSLPPPKSASECGRGRHRADWRCRHPRPSIWVASALPGQGGIVVHRNRSASAPLQRYWKAVPTGMSMETPGVRTVTSSPLSSRRQISPRPDRTCQNSLTVAWTVARFTCPGGTVEWIMSPVVPPIKYRISAPAGERAPGVSGSGRVCMGTPSRARPQPTPRSPLATTEPPVPR